MNAVLLVIDPQFDFCDPRGALFVQGADKDSVRLAEMIRRVGSKLSDIHVTLDSHHYLDVAHPAFWRDSAGQRPTPFTLISHADVASGRWTPFHPGLRHRMMEYTGSLETHGRYQLCIWPPHCLIGTPGHAVAAPVWSALQEWTDRENALIHFVQKGSNVFTEHYSAVQAEVPDPSDPTTLLNTSLIQALATADTIGITGQALSHCVANTVRDIAANFGDEHIGKLALIRDTTSAVPGFEHLANDFVTEMSRRGMQITTAREFLN